MHLGAQDPFLQQPSFSVSGHFPAGVSHDGSTSVLVQGTHSPKEQTGIILLLPHEFGSFSGINKGHSSIVQHWMLIKMNMYD